MAVNARELTDDEFGEKLNELQMRAATARAEAEEFYRDNETLRGDFVKAEEARRQSESELWKERSDRLEERSLGYYERATTALERFERVLDRLEKKV